MIPKSRIHLRGEYDGQRHTKVTVFCNGANCGTLTMTSEEAEYFHHCVAMSTWAHPGEIITSGIWGPDPEELDPKQAG
jgi:hypothetical protein